MAKVQWVPTSQAMKELGVSRTTIYNSLRPKLKNTRRKKYWKVKNPNALRKTYLWNIVAIEEWQQEESESRCLEALDDRGDS